MVVFRTKAKKRRSSPANERLRCHISVDADIELAPHGRSSESPQKLLLHPLRGMLRHSIIYNTVCLTRNTTSYNVLLRAPYVQLANTSFDEILDLPAQ